MIEYDLQTFLQGNLAGSVKVYPLRLPQDAILPAVIYRRISGQRLRSIEGPAGMARPRIELNAYAVRYTEAKALATEIRRLLDGYRGRIGASQVENIIIDSDQDLLDDTTGHYRIIIDAIIWHHET